MLWACAPCCLVSSAKSLGMTSLGLGWNRFLQIDGRSKWCTSLPIPIPIRSLSYLYIVYICNIRCWLEILPILLLLACILLSAISALEIEIGSLREASEAVHRGTEFLTPLPHAPPSKSIKLEFVLGLGMVEIVITAELAAKCWLLGHLKDPKSIWCWVWC